MNLTLSFVLSGAIKKKKNWVNIWMVIVISLRNFFIASNKNPTQARKAIKVPVG